MSEKGWLAQRIEEAQKEIRTWPDWMRESAKFEGFTYEKEDAGDVEPSSDSKSEAKTTPLIKV